jgi:glycosyltransferase involved in cell wall biosynthesis
MKVLFLTNLPSPYRVEFFNELGKSVDLTVLFERRNASDRDEKWKADNYSNFQAVFLKGKPIGNDGSIGIDVLRYLKIYLFDIFIISDYSSPTPIAAINYCIIKRIPYVISSDGALIKNEKYLKKFLKKFLIGGAKAWLCTGKTSVEYLKMFGAKEENIFIYPFTSLKNKDILNQVLSNEEKKVYKQKLGITEEKMVLSVGRFIYSKGYDILINACKDVDKQTGVYIIGGEPTEEYLSIKSSLDLFNVHFISFKTKNELNDYYKAADLFVLPTRSDVWGLVINEAMANGLPIITTDKCVAGLELVQNDVNGYVVSVEDEKILAEKINKLIADSSLCESMAMKSLVKIQDYTVEKMAQRHMEIFEQILEC